MKFWGRRHWNRRRRCRPLVATASPLTKICGISAAAAVWIRNCHPFPSRNFRRRWLCAGRVRTCDSATGWTASCVRLSPVRSVSTRRGRSLPIPRFRPTADRRWRIPAAVWTWAFPVFKTSFHSLIYRCHFCRRPPRSLRLFRLTRTSREVPTSSFVWSLTSAWLRIQDDKLAPVV